VARSQDQEARRTPVRSGLVRARWGLCGAPLPREPLKDALTKRSNEQPGCTGPGNPRQALAAGSATEPLPTREDPGCALTGVELPGDGDAADLRVAEAQQEGPVGLVDEQVVRLLLVDEAEDGPGQSGAVRAGRAGARRRGAGRLLPIVPVRLQVLLQHLHDPVKPLPEGVVPPGQVFLLKPPGK